MYEFLLPDLGEGIHEAEIVSWHVPKGQEVAEDAPLVELETDKATVDIPSPVGGTLVEIAGQAGDMVRVGQVLAVIDTAEDRRDPVPSSENREQKDPKPQVQLSDSPAAQGPTAEGPSARGPVPAAPATRKLARELGIDLRQVTPSGPAGRVTAADVRRHGQSVPDQREQAATSSPSHSPGKPSGSTPKTGPSELPDFSNFGPVEVEALRSIRRKTARKMATSWSEIPHVSHSDQADVTDLEALRKDKKERILETSGVRLTLLSFVAKAVSRALLEHPTFNASLDSARDEIILKRYYNLGIAVATGRGLMVPVIPGADRKSVLQLAADIGDLASRGRKGELKAQDFQGGTFTITNMGAIGGMSSTPIINHPESAILATMRVEQKPLVVDGQVRIRTVLPLVLAFDHRLIDGAEAASFCNTIVRMLSDPQQLLLEA